MDMSKGDGNEDVDEVIVALPPNGPYDPKTDPTLTKQAWRYIKRIKYDYYLMDKEVLEIIEQRERAKLEEERIKFQASELKVEEASNSSTEEFQENDFTTETTDPFEDLSKDEGLGDELDAEFLEMESPILATD